MATTTGRGIISAQPLEVNRGMDHPARTGLIGAGIALGRSFQPNLLTRGSTDQAVISGVTTAFAYGLYSSGDAVVDSLAARISGQDDPGAAPRLIVAGGMAALGAGAFVGFTWHEHESRARAAARLVGRAIVVGSLASAASSLTGSRAAGRRWGVAAAATATAASWAGLAPWRAAPGSLIRQDSSDEHHTQGQERFFEDSVREVAPIKMAAIGAGVALGTYGIARGESLLTHGMARIASATLGGKPEDHRALGRLTAFGLSAGAAYLALNRVSAMLTKGGGAVEPGMETPPDKPEITGCPESGLDWKKQTREGARWLAGTLDPTTIDSVMGTSNATQPIRVYASLDIAEDPHERVAVLLNEIDRTKALERAHFALFSPTGSGYVNYVATETYEFLTGGDCASAAIQYSVLPSSFSLGDVSTGVDQTRMVVDGITQRLLAMEPSKRPKFYLFGESLGSQVSEGMFEGTWTYGLPGAKVDHALWIGTPSATTWRKQLWGDRSITEAPDIGPDGIYLPRTIRDWLNLPDEEREQIQYLLLQNGDDPIPKFGSQLIWRRPDWLGPDRPLGAPINTQWVPGATFLMTFIDMLNALTPTPGVFAQGGHDYREVLPRAISETWRLAATPQQMETMNRVLRERELAWELFRDWAAALAKPADKRDEAKTKTLKKASEWVEHPVDAAELIALVARALPDRAEQLSSMN
ncbi:alpha/beta-hydrolase family protein [Candidatus Nanopelagicales bacterium]|nr:alpha/beta-hydrolase family protein [Candidatus Nanopelagicales bacterium]